MSDDKTSKLERFNVLMVDDERQVLHAAKKLLGRLDFIDQVDISESPKEALEILERRQLLELRERVHILLSDAHIPAEQDGIDFLIAAREMKDSRGKITHPYTIVYSGFSDNEKIFQLSEARIAKPAQLERELTEFRAAYENYWNRIAEHEAAFHEVLPEETITLAEEASETPFETSKFSPLPAIRLPKFRPDRDNHDLLAAEKRPSRFVAFLDMDNTLYEPESQHTIMLHYFANFLLNASGHDFDKDKGSKKHLEMLIRECEAWEQERINTAWYGAPEGRDYKDGINITANLSATAFSGIDRKKLGDYASQFVNHHNLPGRFYEYVPALIQKLRDHGIEPILLTGAPDFLVPYILPLVGLNYGRGMTYKMNPRGDLVVDLNTGLEDGKSAYCELVNIAGYANTLAGGDSPSDKGPFQMAVFHQGRKWDISGAAVMVNGSEASRRSAETTFSQQLNKRVFIVPPKAGADQVLANFGLALRAIFYPMHEYNEIMQATDPDRLRKKLERYEKMRNSLGGLPNIENLKRIRDVLEREGLPKKERTEILERFYPEIYVASAIKKGVVNTRISEELEEYLVEIGCSPETIEEVKIKNQAHHEAQGSFVPERKRSSYPATGPSTHPSEPAEGATATEVKIPPHGDEGSIAETIEESKE
ncbi:haloacid dehalogenase-like hydrolase [Candidatus Peregrinibacteria bacterium]|nr:haloacid dehalogenase-like hydrolase [Candidatus Peregrinibacteria bacterium]